MAQKSLKKNYIFNLSYQILLLITPLVTTPYVSRVLGVDNVGLYSYTNSIVTYFTLVAVLGTATFGNRKIGYLQDNPEERSRAFWELFIFRLIVTSFTMAVYLITFTVILNENRLIYLILGLNVLNVALDVSWFFQGMEEFGKTVAINAFFKIASTVLIFVLVKSADDLPAYILLIAGCLVLGNACLWVYMPKYLKKVKGIRPFRDIKDILQLFVPTVAIQVYTVLDKSMIGWFTETTEENGYYEQAEKVVKMALTVVTSLGAVMVPRISRKFVDGDTEAIKGLLYKSYRFVWMMGVPLALGLVSVASVFVPVFFGEGYEKCVPLIQLFSLLIIFIGFSNVTGLQFFVPTSRQRLLSITVIIGAAVNLALNLVLIPFFFSVGACISSLVAEFVVTFAQFVYVKKTKQFALKPIFSCCFKYLLGGGIMCGLLFLIKYFLPVTWWALLILIASGIIIYFLALLALRDRFFLDALKKALSTATRIFKKKPAPQTVAEENEITADAEEVNDK